MAEINEHTLIRFEVMLFYLIETFVSHSNHLNYPEVPFQIKFKPFLVLVSYLKGGGLFEDLCPGQHLFYFNDFILRRQTRR